MYRIDLLCAKIDLVQSPYSTGGGAFMIKEDDGLKATYTFASRVAAYAEEWALACRKARRDDAIPAAELLSYLELSFTLISALSVLLHDRYAKSLHGKPQMN